MTTHCDGRGSFTGTLPAPAARGPLAAAPAAPVLLATGYLIVPALPAGPVWLGALRVAAAGLVVLLVWPGRPRGNWWWRSTVTGTATLGGTFVLQAAATQQLGATLAAGLVASTVLINTVRAVLRGRERPVTVLVTLGAVAALSVALRATPHAAGNRWTLLGVLAALGAAGCLALGKDLTERWGHPAGVRAITVTGWQLAAGAVVLTPIAYLIEGPPPSFNADQWVLFAWLALAATACAYGIQLGGLHAGVPAAVVSRLAMLTPVLTATLAWWVDDRLPSLVEVVALVSVVACIVTGVLLALPREARR